MLSHILFTPFVAASYFIFIAQVFWQFGYPFLFKKLTLTVLHVVQILLCNAVVGDSYSWVGETHDGLIRSLGKTTSES